MTRTGNVGAAGRAAAIASLALLAPWLATAAVNIQLYDGATYTTVHNGESVEQRYNIVVLGDGFTAAQQDDFNARVQDAVAALQARSPYSLRMCGLNIFRVNVVSTDSGVDHPGNTPPVSKDTELGVRYGNPGNGEAERCITSSDPAAIYEAAAYAPDADAIFVLANDTQWGGCAGSLVFSSISPGFEGIVTHELGHKIAALADEYQCYRCDGTDSTAPYAGPEPAAVNLTQETTRTQVKWGDLIDPATPLPTTVDNPGGVVGLWEGGGYVSNGLYRPQNNCHMRSTGSPFCQVCDRDLRTDLGAHCTACELSPTFRNCFQGPLIDRWRFAYKYPFRIRWPFPPCLTCPPDWDRRDWRVRIEAVPEGFSAQVVDGTGRVVGRGARGKDGAIDVTWKRQAPESYAVELVSGRTPTGETVELTVRLFVGSQELRLPAIQGAMDGTQPSAALQPVKAEGLDAIR